MRAQETTQFRATAGANQGFGKSPQEALNALMPLLQEDTAGPIVTWPYIVVIPTFL